MLDFNLPYLNDEQKSLAMLIKEFCEREVDLRALCDMADQPIPPNATPAQLRSRLPLELLSKAHDAGIRQICAPAEYGGGGYEEDHVAQGAMAEMAGYMGGHFGRLMTIAWKQMAAFKWAPKEIAKEVLEDYMNDRTTMMAASLRNRTAAATCLCPMTNRGLQDRSLRRKKETSGS